MKHLVKRSVRWAADGAAFSACLGLLERIERGGRANLLRVLTYHRVAPQSEPPLLDASLISATPEVFAEQMRYVAEHFRVASAAELLTALRSGVELPPRTLMVTFDDAYRDFAEYAWPILQRYEIPVTLFVPTGFPDRLERTFWWDQLYAAVFGTTASGHVDRLFGPLRLATDAQRTAAFKQLKAFFKSLPHDQAMYWVNRFCSEIGGNKPVHHVLGWDDLRRLSREGVTLGAHTRTHPLMNRISPGEARREAVESLRDLEREVGSVEPIFAYPSGECSHEVCRLLEREGFAFAFTTARGINQLGVTDPLRLRRINVGPRTTQAILRSQMLSWPAHLYQRRRPVGQASSLPVAAISHAGSSRHGTAPTAARRISQKLKVKT